MLIASEDLHWADPTSLDLLWSLAERRRRRCFSSVAATRPEFRPLWTMRSHHGVISLAPLDRAQVRRMVGEIASRHALSDEMIDGVGERSGGVPLFVEEVTRLLLERNVQGGAQAIPPTLQQSLAARLDRLGEAREVAQIGAVLGPRIFLPAAQRRVVNRHAGFDEICDYKPRSIISRKPTSCSWTAPLRLPRYRFKHALIQDAAYGKPSQEPPAALHTPRGPTVCSPARRPKAKRSPIASSNIAKDLENQASPGIVSGIWKAVRTLS